MRSPPRTRLSLCLCLCLCLVQRSARAVGEEPVAIAGYSGGIEEPFVSRDGAFLLFNSSEQENNKDLQLARFIDGKLVYQRPLSEPRCLRWPGGLS